MSSKKGNTMTVINQRQVTELLAQLIRIPSPYFEEERVMSFAKNWLAAKGLPAEIHTYREEKITGAHGTNVIGCLDSGIPGPTIYLNGHLDTVKLCQGWTLPPYEAVVQDGLMYGVGALDMKSGCAALMMSLAAFTENVKSFQGKIRYHLVSDEEGPFGLGTTFLIHDEKVGKADFAIVTEPSAGFVGKPFPVICPGARGGYQYTIRIHGKSAHAANPEMGINAVADASRVVKELEEIPMKVDDKLGSASNCVIGMSGGGAACSVPDTAEIQVFRHTVLGEGIQTIRKEASEAVERAGISGSWEFLMREAPVKGFDGGFSPYTTEEDSPYMAELGRSVERVCKTPPLTAYFKSMGDFNLVAAAGIPTVLFGAEGRNYHSADECVSLKSVHLTAEVIYDFLIHITKAQKA